MHYTQGPLTLQHGDIAARRAIIRPFGVLDALEAEGVTTDRHRIADRHAHITFGFIALDQRHANNEHRHAAMREQHAIVASRLTRQPRPQIAANHRQPQTQIHHRRGQYPEGQQQAEANHRAPLAHRQRQQQGARHAHGKSPFHAHQQIGQARLFPARHRADAHQEERRGHQRHKHAIEVRWAD